MGKEITTEADKLMTLIDKEGKISAKKASEVLGMNYKQVKEWADFLERNGVIDLNLNFFDMKLISKKKDPKAIPVK